MKQVSAADIMLFLVDWSAKENFHPEMNPFQRDMLTLTFLLENICTEFDEDRSGENINSVSVVILVSFDKVIKTESRR
jgi:hypothetical protein